jgi:glycosyltransferase involved in cell wall biosynthesis
VGRLSEQKGQLLLLEAAAEVAATAPDFRLTLVGDGELRAPTERRIAELGLGDVVEITGWADEAEVRRRILAARALVLASFAEGLPVVIMEAMALRRPVISTWVAGIPELVDADCGWLVPAGDAGALAGAMRAALSAPPERLAAMGRAGRARVEARHDQRAEARRLLALIGAHPVGQCGHG